MTPLRTLALFGLLAAAIAFSPSAYAEEGEGGGANDELKKKIQQKMEKILELMRENEAALLKLSTGKAAETKKVDVEVPEGTSSAKKDPKGSDGASGEKGKSGSKGEAAGKKIEELLAGLSKKGGSIPDEIKQLIEMIPL